MMMMMMCHELKGMVNSTLFTWGLQKLQNKLKENMKTSGVPSLPSLDMSEFQWYMQLRVKLLPSPHPHQIQIEPSPSGD